ncbi:hypothetical protein BDQ17DRAFT_1332512 [Cyathus striatus]|nr:hypothetical protein BDQ17DRAFT_1332512 [Cyathus striatus]
MCDSVTCAKAGESTFFFHAYCRAQNGDGDGIATIIPSPVLPTAVAFPIHLLPDIFTWLFPCQNLPHLSCLPCSYALDNEEFDEDNNNDNNGDTYDLVDEDIPKDFENSDEDEEGGVYDGKVQVFIVQAAQGTKALFRLQFTPDMEDDLNLNEEDREVREEDVRLSPRDLGFGEGCKEVGVRLFDIFNDAD